MNGRNFASKRARILDSGRPERTKRKAIRHLARETEAEKVFAGGRLVAHVFPDGFTVCELRRYKTERAAIEELANVHAFAHLHDRRIPVRGFWCASCKGWHTTARA